MGVLGFILGYGTSGRGVKVDANGAILANAGSGTYLPLSYGDTGRASCVDASGRLMVNLDGTGETNFINASGLFVKSVASAGGTTLVKTGTAPSVSLKGLTAGTGVKLTGGTNDVVIDVKDFANASGAFIKTITGSSGIIATKSGSTYAIKESMLIAKPFKTVAWASGLTVDLAQYNNYYIAMGANNTVIQNINNPTDGGKYLFVIKQNNAGSKTITFPSAVKWVGGTAIALTAASGSIDACTLVWCAPLSIYIASPGLDIK